MDGGWLAGWYLSLSSAKKAVGASDAGSLTINGILEKRTVQGRTDADEEGGWGTDVVSSTDPTWCERIEELWK